MDKELEVENVEESPPVVIESEEVIDEVHEEVHEEEKPKSHINNRDLVKKLYLEDKKNYDEISSELGIAISTVKLYVSQGGYCRNPRPKRNRKKKDIQEDTTDDDTHTEDVQESKTQYHTYDNIGNGYYMRDDGKLCRKMTKQEFVDYMMAEMERRKNKRS